MNIIKSIIINSKLYQELLAEREVLKEAHKDLSDRLFYEEQSNERMSHTFSEDIEKLTVGRKFLQANLREKCERVKELEAFRESVLLSELTSIKFMTHNPNIGWYAIEYKVGAGSCDKNVMALQWLEEDDRYVLTQVYTEGNWTRCTYYKKDIAGSIEVTYKASNRTHWK